MSSPIFQSANYSHIFPFFIFQSVSELWNCDLCHRTMNPSIWTQHIHECIQLFNNCLCPDIVINNIDHFFNIHLIKFYACSCGRTHTSKEIMNHHSGDCIGHKGCVLCKWSGCVCGLNVGTSPYCSSCMIPIRDPVTHFIDRHAPHINHVYPPFSPTDQVLESLSKLLITRSTFECYECMFSSPSIMSLASHFLECHISNIYFHCCRYPSSDLYEVYEHAKECPY